MPCFNPTAPPLPLEQLFYRLSAPSRSAADTMAHSSGAAASSQSTHAAHMLPDLPRTTNVAASIRPCIVGWDSMEPQGQLPWVFHSAICNVNKVPSATHALRKYT
uniref:Uncharacterized protein n=1 Tax=Romanomermis culicivorax TaxID=13658 RepID=A0A915IDI8_ROMCU